MVKGTRAQAEALKEQIATLLAKELKLTLSPSKTLVTHIDDGFEFLGFHIVRKLRAGNRQVYTFPSPKAFAAVKRAVKALTRRHTRPWSLTQLLAHLNPILRGWCNYFRFAASKRTFAYLEHLLLVARRALVVEEAPLPILETIQATGIDWLGDYRPKREPPLPSLTGDGGAISLPRRTHRLSLGRYVAAARRPAQARNSDHSETYRDHGEPDAWKRARPVRRAERGNGLSESSIPRLAPTLLTPPSVIEAKDLLEVIDDRSQVRSTLVVSQLPVEAWHPALAGGDPTLADAILDRLVQHAHRLPLTGASMRRRQPPPETENPVA